MTQIKQRLVRGGFFVFEGLDRSGKSTQSRLLAEKLHTEGYPVKIFRFPDRSTGTGKLLDSYLSQPSSSSSTNTETSSSVMNPQILHLLFSANRWESINKIESFLYEGISVICDRYSFSGIAYSLGAANFKYSRRLTERNESTRQSKSVLQEKEQHSDLPVLVDIEFCKNTEKGLLRPDAVFFIGVPPDEARNRKGFGKEFYEDLSIQKNIYDIYRNFSNLSYWIEIRGMDTQEEACEQKIGQESSQQYNCDNLVSRSEELIHLDVMKKVHEILDELHNDSARKYMHRLWE